MAKNLKLNIKNTQIAKALNLDSLKEKLAQKKISEEVSEVSEAVEEKAKSSSASKAASAEKTVPGNVKEESTVKARARSKSVFSESQAVESSVSVPVELPQEQESLDSQKPIEEVVQESNPVPEVSQEEPAPVPAPTPTPASVETTPIAKATPVDFSEAAPQETKRATTESKFRRPQVRNPFKPNAGLERVEKPQPQPVRRPIQQEVEKTVTSPLKAEAPIVQPKPDEKPIKLGPTGRHVKDLLPQKREEKIVPPAKSKTVDQPSPQIKEPSKIKEAASQDTISDENKKKASKATKFKEFRDLKPTKRQPDQSKSFDTRDRQGLRGNEEDSRWRKKRQQKQKFQEDVTIRPATLKVRVPISIKDLASEMKLKASQLIAKLFLQGTIYTLNDLLDDETTIQLLGHEFQCEITIDSSEEERIRITDKTIREEISETPPEKLQTRAPIAAFMGHVDHGKTSLIDAIRTSNRVAGEAGAITQHIGAFKCSTVVGDITVLDTPGHEAFSEMRARGADVTDIVVLVVAGDEGLMQQTAEAIQHAKAAGVTIIVAINKCDKPNFDLEKVYRQLAENDLLPEAWGGTTITIKCSATTKEGIPELLEMLALQAEVLELKANPDARARGAIIESQMHKGMGAIATILIQNGTLRHGDALVFDQYWGRVKTMRDENNKSLKSAGPSTPVEITGLSGLPSAGQEFIVVSSEKEAREIAEARANIFQKAQLQRRPMSIETLLTESNEASKKVLNVIIRADVQGSLEALKVALQKIESDKVNVNVIFTGVGEISESDVQLAAASKAVIIGFHTGVESHAEPLIKQYGVQIRLHDVIYHAIDSTKEMMAGTLDRLAQEIPKGKALVKATFKSSQHGIIAGCVVTEGLVQRNHHLRIMRNGVEVWKGNVSSLKRHKEDVREVTKGIECGVLLSTNNIEEGDILEFFEVIYIKQEL